MCPGSALGCYTGRATTTAASRNQSYTSKPASACAEEAGSGRLICSVPGELPGGAGDTGASTAASAIHTTAHTPEDPARSALAVKLEFASKACNSSCKASDSISAPVSEVTDLRMAQQSGLESEPAIGQAAQVGLLDEQEHLGAAQVVRTLLSPSTHTHLTYHRAFKDELAHTRAGRSTHRPDLGHCWCRATPAATHGAGRSGIC